MNTVMITTMPYHGLAGRLSIASERTISPPRSPPPSVPLPSLPDTGALPPRTQHRLSSSAVEQPATSTDSRNRPHVSLSKQRRVIQFHLPSSSLMPASSPVHESTSVHGAVNNGPKVKNNRMISGVREDHDHVKTTKSANAAKTARVRPDLHLHFLSQSSSPVGWPFSTNSPRISKTSKRSTRPPRKAIARAALYIPSTPELEQFLHFHASALDQATCKSVSIPDYEPSILTTLPPLPGSCHGVSRESLPLERDNGDDGVVGNQPCLACGKLGANSLPTPCQHPSEHTENAGRLSASLARARATNRRDATGAAKVTSQTWTSRRKKQIWALCIGILVLVIAGGVTGGVLWNLRRA